MRQPKKKLMGVVRNMIRHDENVRGTMNAMRARGLSEDDAETEIASRLLKNSLDGKSGS